MSKKQTAVEWLMENLHTAKNPFEQAKAMEKEQMIKAFNEGTFANDEKVTAEQYYNETYGNE
jgi:uncharacterized Fe-S cluster-containing MiaB family protein